MNQVYLLWDECCNEIQELRLSPENCAVLATLRRAAALSSQVAMDLIDLWFSEATKQEVGYKRQHRTLARGTHMLSARFGRDKEYVIAWHPQDPDTQRVDLDAFLSQPR